MTSAEVKRYDPDMTMSVPAVLPATDGHTVLLPMQVLRGLQVTLPAPEVSVTLRADAGMPTA